MASDSPPPLDACPELTPDNGTTTSSGSGSVYRRRRTHRVEEDNGNSQLQNNILYIFDNVNHPAPFSGTNNISEHNGVPARERPTPRSHHLRSPHLAPTTPPRPGLPSLVRTDLISPVDIGPPMLSLSFDSRQATGTTIPSPSGSSSRRGQGRGWFRDLLSRSSAWFGRNSMVNRNGARPRLRPRLSWGWFARRRNAGS